MEPTRVLRALLIVVLAAACWPVARAQAQGTWPDDQRALSLRDTYQDAAAGMADPATWIEGTDRFWYRRSVTGGCEFVLVDAERVEKRPAADRLQAHVLLAVGEMDTNVDPSSTMQVVDQLIKHDKGFDLLVVPGMGHGNGGAYGEHKRFDFFVRHLLGVMPPDWSAFTKPEPSKTATP